MDVPAVKKARRTLLSKLVSWAASVRAARPEP